MVIAGTSRLTGAQQTFRVLLMAMANPGTIQLLPLLAGESSETSLLFSLADHEVRFALAAETAEGYQDRHERARRLTDLTGSPCSAVADADFVLSRGPLPAGVWSQLRRGTPAFPDRSATLIYILPAVGILLPNAPRTEVTLTGPGIELDQRLLVTGLSAREFILLAETNRDFPLGVDVILADPTGRLACIPRSSTIALCR